MQYLFNYQSKPTLKYTIACFSAQYVFSKPWRMVWKLTCFETEAVLERTQANQFFS